MMTNIKINVIGILCVMFYEDLILIQYYFKIGGKWDQYSLKMD